MIIFSFSFFFSFFESFNKSFRDFTFGITSYLKWKLPMRRKKNAFFQWNWFNSHFGIEISYISKYDFYGFSVSPFGRQPSFLSFSFFLLWNINIVCRKCKVIQWSYFINLSIFIFLTNDVWKIDFIILLFDS